MPMYSRILDGAEIERRQFMEMPPILAEGKGRWVPVVILPYPVCNSKAETVVRNVVVATDQVVEDWSIRPKTSDELRADVLAQIAALEWTITNRRLREAALTDEGRAWLADADAQIAALRARLV